MDQIVAEIRKIPPVTRFLTLSSISVTVVSVLKIVSPYSLVFERNMVLKEFQIWRLYTSFFLGGGGLNYLFDLIMLYRTSNDIETRSYHLRSSDMAWQTLWACVGIVGATMPLRTFIFTRPLLLCLVYLYAALAPAGATTSIMGLITIPIVYYPYALIALDLVMGGPQAAAQAVAGAAVGHVWWWAVWGGGLASRGLLQTWGSAPAWMRSVLGEDVRPPPTPDALGGAAAGLARGGVHVSAPRAQAATGAGAGTGTGGANATGYSWGSGQRLGTS